jgi:hypothetical protein
LVKAWQKWVVPADVTTFSSEYQIFSADQFSKDAKEVQARVDRYLYNARQMNRLAADIPTLIVLQPEITGKQKSLTKEEDGILKSLGKDYSDRAMNSYKIAEKTLSSSLTSTKFINFYQLFQDSNQQAFIDPIHLTEGANEIVAQKLYESIEGLFSVQPIPSSQNGEIVAPPTQPIAPPPTNPEAISNPPASLSETLQRVQGQ